MQSQSPSYLKIASLLTFAIFAFQNCSPAKFSTTNSNKVTSASTEDVDVVDGNGNTGGGNTAHATPPPSIDDVPAGATPPGDGISEHENDDDDSNGNDPDYDDDDRSFANYNRVYHRILTMNFNKGKGAAPATHRFERLISLDETVSPEICRFTFDADVAGHTRHRERDIQLKFCSGYFNARVVREKVGQCTPKQIVLKQKANKYVTISRSLNLDANCVCHYDRELNFAAAADKSGLVSAQHLRQRFANPSVCAANFPEYSDASDTAP